MYFGVFVQSFCDIFEHVFTGRTDIFELGSLRRVGFELVLNILEHAGEVLDPGKQSVNILRAQRVVSSGVGVLFRDAFKLSWSADKVFSDFPGELRHGQKVPNPEPKRHAGDTYKPKRKKKEEIKQAVSCFAGWPPSRRAEANEENTGTDMITPVQRGHENI